MNEEEQDENTFAEKRLNPELMAYAGQYLSGKQTFRRWHLVVGAILIAVTPPPIGFSIAVIGTAIMVYANADKPLTVQTEVKVKEDE